MQEIIEDNDQSQQKRRLSRFILVMMVFGAAIAGALSALVFPWIRDQTDPYWRLRGAFGEIGVPGTWQLVHYEKVEERFITPWGGAGPTEQRTYLAREEPRAACRTSNNILAAWSRRRVERVPVESGPYIHWRCRSLVERDGVLAEFTVWDRAGWRVDEFRPSVGGHPIGDGTSVIELDIRS